MKLPVSCLAWHKYGNAKVYVVRDGKAHLTSIRIGPKTGNHVTVLSGLRPHDLVVENVRLQGETVPVRVGD